jgi:hypothetical protein
MVHTLAISPYQRVEYNFDMEFINKENFIWIGFVSKNGRPINFQIMDRENNLVIYKSGPKIEFMAKLVINKRENLKFIFINEETTQVREYVSINNQRNQE